MIGTSVREETLTRRCVFLATILAILVGGHLGRFYRISIHGVVLDSRRIWGDQVSGSDGVDRKHAVRGNRGRWWDQDRIEHSPRRKRHCPPSRRSCNPRTRVKQDHPLSAPETKGVRDEEMITYDFLEMGLAEESICDFNSCGGHD